jgi:hypothetical protein
MGATSSAEADLATGTLPRTLTLLHRAGSLGPIDVDIHGMLGDGIVVTLTLELTFEEGRSLRFVVSLDAACVAIGCAMGETCAAGECRPAEVRACEAVGRTCADAGAPDAPARDADGGDAGAADAGDADACGSAESCNGVDDDCDGAVDEGFDTATDPDNCGVCGRVCPTSGDRVIGGSCAAGTCSLECEAGRGDCNRDAADGCETDVSAAMMHCGACGAFCPTAGTFHAADAVCTSGRCILSCDADWGDCDGDRATGCETHVSIDRANCGTCGNVCPAGQMCRSSSCS